MSSHHIVQLDPGIPAWDEQAPATAHGHDSNLPGQPDRMQHDQFQDLLMDPRQPGSGRFFPR